jgi:hypothetical protein
MTRQIVRRTIRRVVTRQTLWNGNREPFANLYRWDPNKNVIRWTWTRHSKYEQRYTNAQTESRFGHLTFVVLRSHQEADRWVEALGECQRSGT